MVSSWGDELMLYVAMASMKINKVKAYPTSNGGSLRRLSLTLLPVQA